MQNPLRVFCVDDSDLHHILQLIKSYCIRSKAIIVLGAGLEGQVFVPPAEMSTQEAGALLRLGCSWQELVSEVVAHFAKLYGLNAQWQSTLFDVLGQGPDQDLMESLQRVQNQIQMMAPLLGMLPTLGRLCGDLLEKWQVVNACHHSICVSR